MKNIINFVLICEICCVFAGFGKEPLDVCSPRGGGGAQGENFRTDGKDISIGI